MLGFYVKFLKFLKLSSELLAFPNYASLTIYQSKDEGGLASNCILNNIFTMILTFKATI